MGKKAKKIGDLKLRTKKGDAAAAVKGGDATIPPRSNIQSTHNKTADAIVQNIRG